MRAPRLYRDSALGLAVVAFAALAGGAGCCQLGRAFLFPASSVVEPPDIGETLEIEARDRTCVAVHVPASPADSGRATIAYFHGNGQQLSDLTSLARAFTRERFGFFAVEYPGYGVAEGTPSEESLYACADIALRHLEGPLGGKLVLISPYTSIPELFASKGAPPSLSCDRFDSAAKAPSVAMPVLIVHGADDSLIPAAMGRTLAARFPDARLELVRGGHHNDLFSDHATQTFGAIVTFALALAHPPGVRKLEAR